MSNQLMLIGQVQREGKLIGYSVLHVESNRARLMTIPETVEAINSLGCINAVVNASGKIEGTQASLSRLPIYDIQGKIVAQPRVTILAEILNGGTTVGYALMDAWGRKGKFSVDKAIELIMKFESTNAKLVSRENGKTFISAIFGEFDKIQHENTAKKIDKADEKAFDEKEPEENTPAPAPEKEAPYVRKLTDARYIGEPDAGKDFNIVNYVMMRSAVKYYNKLLQARDVKRSLGIYRSEQKSSIGKVVCKEATELLKDVIAGKFGKKTDKHYPKAMGMLKDTGNPRLAAQRIHNFRVEMRATSGTGENWEEFIKDNLQAAMEYTQFVENVLVDCLTYKRANLTVKMSKELVDILANNAGARDYITKSMEEEFSRSLITNAVLEASKNKIDGISEIMYLTALEFLWATKSVTNPERRRSMMIVGIAQISALTEQKPKSIEGKKDLGAMLFQALIIAMTLK